MPCSPRYGTRGTVSGCERRERQTVSPITDADRNTYHLPFGRGEPFQKSDTQQTAQHLQRPKKPISALIGDQADEATGVAPGIQST